MSPRDINFGSSEADAKYQISDDGNPGNFVLARDTNGAVVLLQWNATAGQWEYGGPVDMDGNDLVDAGTTVYDASTGTVGDGTTSADHTAVTTDVGAIGDSSQDPTSNGEIRRNGTDIKAYTGGGVKNLSNIGAGSTKAHPTIRVAVDGSEAVAYNQDGTELSRSTNHASVIQAAIDAVSPNSLPSNADGRNLPVGGIVDGNGYEYDVSSSVTLKSNILFQNFHLNAGGANGFNILEGTTSPPLHGVVLQNVICKKSGDSNGIDIVPKFGTILTNVWSVDNGNRGIVLRGPIGVRGFNIYSTQNASTQILVDDHSTSVSNDVKFYGGVVAGGVDGVTLTKTVNTTDHQDDFLFSGFDFTGMNQAGLEVVQYTDNVTVDRCWFESDANIDVGASGNCRGFTIRDCKIQRIFVNNSDNANIIRNSTEINKSLDITINAGATLTYLENNDLQNGSVTNNGSHTQYGGRRSSLSDPSVVTSSRSFNTAYQNSNDHDLRVIVAVLVDGSTSGEINTVMYQSQNNNTNSEYGVDRVRVQGIASSDVVIHHLKTTVPPGNYYEVRSFGVETMNRWVERPLTEG